MLIVPPHLIPQSNVYRCYQMSLGEQNHPQMKTTVLEQAYFLTNKTNWLNWAKLETKSRTNTFFLQWSCFQGNYKAMRQSNEVPSS